MARLKNVPFVPNMEDCKMIVETNGAVCYIMDTCCRNFTAEDKARADRQIVEIAMRSALRFSTSRIACASYSQESASRTSSGYLRMCSRSASISGLSAA